MQTSDRPPSDQGTTAPQRHARTSFGSASDLWNQIAENQRRAWDEAAKQDNRRRHRPRKARLSGQNLFIEINSHQAFLGLPPLLDPPEFPAFDLVPPEPLISLGGKHGLALKVRLSKVPAGHVLVYGARPCNAGRRYCDKLRFLGLLPPLSRGIATLTTLYFKRFGAPWPGARVVITVQQQINGWRGQPCRLDMIVPKMQAPPARSKRRRTTAAA